AALAAIGVDLTDDGPQPPLPFGLPLDQYERALDAAGFVHPFAHHVETGWEVRDAAPIVDGFERYVGADVFTGDEQRAAFAAELQVAVQSRARPDGTSYFPNPAILAAAR